MGNEEKRWMVYYDDEDKIFLKNYKVTMKIVNMKYVIVNFFKKRRKM